MELEVLIPIIVFLFFSLISPLIKRLRGTREPDETKLQRRQTSRDAGADDPFEEEFDLSEWEVLFGPPEPEPKPEPKPPSEFQEVHGKRPVSEADTGPEFQEVHGKRPVSEADTGPEFQEVHGKRPVSDESSYIEGKTLFTRASETQTLLRPKRKKRRIKLDFEPNTIRKAIIYNEIIGPPRAETDHFKNP
ncbi:MAG: hypothetical protein F4Y79_11925 [Gemmatimonadetes bacterium]|nr:hypothetical protein [Gemmatimonadota bacterium]MYF17437.1 hypothetical protein [Gemmatimonadota bacterium]